MSKKEGSRMASAVLEMNRLVRLAASPQEPGERVPHAIARAARRLGIDRGRVESFWYGKARAVGPDELERARAVALERSKDAELLRNEYRRAIDILARLEARLSNVDEDFYGPEVAAARDMVRRADRTRSDRG